MYAPIFRNHLLAQGTAVSLSQHRIFCCEAEFGLVLGNRITPRKTPYTEAETWAHVDHVELCIELCGTRQTTTEDRLHYVADALLGACVVRGPSIGKPASPGALVTVEVSLYVAGVKINTGSARNNPCDSPLASLTYLVNQHCVKRGLSLEPGTLVIAGHCCQAGFAGRPTPPFANNPTGKWVDGDKVEATFGQLGRVHAVLQN